MIPKDNKGKVVILWNYVAQWSSNRIRKSGAEEAVSYKAIRVSSFAFLTQREDSYSTFIPILNT